MNFTATYLPESHFYINTSNENSFFVIFNFVPDVITIVTNNIMHAHTNNGKIWHLCEINTGGGPETRPPVGLA